MATTFPPVSPLRHKTVQQLKRMAARGHMGAGFELELRSGKAPVRSTLPNKKRREMGLLPPVVRC